MPGVLLAYPGVTAQGEPLHSACRSWNAMSALAQPSALLLSMRTGIAVHHIAFNKGLTTQLPALSCGTCS